MDDVQKSGNAATQARYKERMREAGYRQIAIWVKDDDVDKVKRYVAELEQQRGNIIAKIKQALRFGL
jgi:hypothetical protein